HWEKPLKRYDAFAGHDDTNLLTVLNRDDASLRLLRPEDARPGAAGSFFVDPVAPPEERFKATFLAHQIEENMAYGAQTGREVSAMTGPRSTVIFGAVSADGIG